MLKSLDSPTRRLYLLLLAGFVLFGVAFTAAGAALPRIISTFGWSYTVSGLVLAASAAGYFLSSFLNGFLVQRVAPKTIMLVCLAIGALCMSLFARWPSPWLNLALNLGVGMCQGALEVVSNLEVIHMEQGGQSRLMNLMHAVFCIGAILGPMAVASVLRSGLPLIAVFIAGGALFAVLVPWVAFVRFPRVREQHRQNEPGALQLLRQPLVLLMTVVILVYVGTEVGINSWASEYVVKVLGVSASTGALGVALFWVGLLAGRLAISFSYKGTRQELLMLGLASLSAAALVGVLLAKSVPVVEAAIFVAGLGCSGFYPLGMSLLGRHFRSGVAVGTVATGGAAGSITFPFFMALLSQGIGIRAGFSSYLVMSLVLVALSVLLVRVVRRAQGAPAASR